MCFSSSVSENREADPITAPDRIDIDRVVFGRSRFGNQAKVRWRLGMTCLRQRLRLVDPVRADIPLSGCLRRCGDTPYAATWDLWEIFGGRGDVETLDELAHSPGIVR
jgi:hypothetical protein